MCLFSALELLLMFRSSGMFSLFLLHVSRNWINGSESEKTNLGRWLLCFGFSSDSVLLLLIK